MKDEIVSSKLLMAATGARAPQHASMTGDG